MPTNEWKYATLEQSQKLKALGWKLETEKYWIDSPMFEGWAIRPKADVKVYECESYPTPDVAELGLLLPERVKDSDGEEIFSITNDIFRMDTFQGPEWCVSMIGGSTYVTFKTEAEARCRALIWLIENKYLTN